MSINYDIKTPSGRDAQVTPAQIAQRLGKEGYNVVGTSADGTEFTINDAQGGYTIPVQAALEQLGMQVTNSAPSAPNFDAVSPLYRAAVEKLPDDESRQAYLQMKMRKDFNLQKTPE